MKFAAFVLATAAATASAQYLTGGNPFAGVVYPGQVPAAVAYPVPANVDPFAWERDCTWVNSAAFRQVLSQATCGTNSCYGIAQVGGTAPVGPNGNGGGHTKLAASSTANTGYNVWGTVINRAGRVCAVAYTGENQYFQFPYGRILSMKVANTANSLSLPNRAQPSHVRSIWSSSDRGLKMNGAIGGETGLTGSLYQAYAGSPPLLPIDGTLGTVDATKTSASPARQDDWSRFGVSPTILGSQLNFPYGTTPTALAGTNLVGSLAGLGLNAGLGWNAESQWFGFTLPAEQFNPGNIDVHYQGAASNYGEACGATRMDPMCMQKPGGYSYQAGGLALYDVQGVVRGAIGVSGDNDCTNHAIAWKARFLMQLHYVPNHSVADERDDVYAANTANNKLILGSSTVEVHWAGKFAEDNVIFEPFEQELFPKCQAVIQNFLTTNPTKGNSFNVK